VWGRFTGDEVKQFLVQIVSKQSQRNPNEYSIEPLWDGLWQVVSREWKARQKIHSEFQTSVRMISWQQHEDSKVREDTQAIDNQDVFRKFYIILVSMCINQFPYSQLPRNLSSHQELWTTSKRKTQNSNHASQFGSGVNRTQNYRLNGIVRTGQISPRSASTFASSSVTILVKR
jgi:hypothetical protein